MKQTAVEFLLEKYKSQNGLLFPEDFKQAKETEENHIDNFAIEFAEWCLSKDAIDLINDLTIVGEIDPKPKIKVLLEIYKNL
jgi:hypothetical protein